MMLMSSVSSKKTSSFKIGVAVIDHVDVDGFIVAMKLIAE